MKYTFNIKITFGNGDVKTIENADAINLMAPGWVCWAFGNLTHAIPSVGISNIEMERIPVE